MDNRFIYSTKHIISFFIKIIVSFLFITTESRAQEVWLPLIDRDLIVIGKNNPLDFSNLNKAGFAGQYGWAVALPDGHIGFEKLRQSQHFLCASLVFNSLNGGIPDHTDSIRLVEQLHRTGYNLVRLHFIDAHLMAGRLQDFDFDPEQFDHLHYLLSQLKQAGIYWIVDGMTSDNAGYGNVQPHRYIKKYSAKVDVLSSHEGFLHWSNLVERLWGKENPYTGMSTLEDPALLGIILINEGGIDYLSTINGNKYSDKLSILFAKWLKSHYNNENTLKSAWHGGFGLNESLDSRVFVPDSIRGQSPRSIDFSKFVADLEKETYFAMTAHVQKLGFKGLTTAYDNWGFFNTDISRATPGWVDMHSYHVLPTNHGRVGSSIQQISVHQNSARYVRELTNARQWGKPFTVSEYSQPFWNRWRNESAALIPAVAAHQGWDAICQFSETPIQFDYGPSNFSLRQAIFPYGVGADPIAHAGERLAAMLYLRGDVAPARSSIHIHLDAQASLTRNGGWEQIPEGLSRLGLVSAIGIDMNTNRSQPQPGQLSINLPSDSSQWREKLESQLLRGGLDVGSWSTASLRDAGLISSKNLTQVNNGTYHSDTEQILFNNDQKIITITTDKTLVIVAPQGNFSAGSFQVENKADATLFAISSLDGKPVNSSQRLLLWVLTDAINTGMTFEDSTRQTIKSVGHFPPMVKPAIATLRFSNENAKKFKIWPLSLNGTRHLPIPTSVQENKLEVHIDTQKLPDGPALFFEISTESALH